MHSCWTLYLLYGLFEFIDACLMFCCFLMLFRGEKDVVGGDARDDLASFWLRKTKRPVLAVLLVQKKGGEPQLYRGTNMEVGVEENKPYSSVFQQKYTYCYGT